MQIKVSLGPEGNRRANENSDEVALADPLACDIGPILKRASEETPLDTVKEIKLKVNSREVLLSQIGIYLPHLKNLDLSGSMVTSLRDLGTNLVNLEVLFVMKCGLVDLDGILCLKRLMHLNVSNNRIERLGLIGCLMNLQTLNLSGNLIEDNHQMKPLIFCSKLKVLNLIGNPCCKKDNYRQYITNMLEQLLVLDGYHVDSLDALGHDEIPT